MKTPLLFLIFCLSNFSLFSQKELLKVDLQPIDSTISCGYAIEPVYELSSKKKFKFWSKKFKIKLPKKEGDFGMIVVYQRKTTGKNASSKSCFMLVENYKSSQPKFYLDSNLNFDFSDDLPKQFGKDSIKVFGKSFRYLEFEIENDKGLPYKFFLIEPDALSKSHWGPLRNQPKKRRAQKMVSN